MSRVLIDTQALIWFAENSPAISKDALKLVDDSLTTRFASAASFWEMAIKIGLGKLTLKVGTLPEFAPLVRANDVDVLPVTGEDATAVADLPKGDHKDPFDRLIAAQCLRLDLTLVSSDHAFD